LRWPTASTSKAQPQHDLLERDLGNEVANLRETTFLLVSSHDKYGPFSNQVWHDDSAAVYGSLEDLHNTMHIKTGGLVEGVGKGHMGRVPYSAFDPVFWLHHT